MPVIRARLPAAVALVAVMALTLAPLTRALACTCNRPNEAEDFQAAAAVFEGVAVASRERPGFDATEDRDLSVLFAVERTLKGNPSTGPVEVITETSGSACGVGFQVGDRWRVFARSFHGELETNSCYSNQRIAEHVPIPPTQTSGSLASVVLAVGVLGLIGAVALVAFRRTPGVS